VNGVFRSSTEVGAKAPVDDLRTGKVQHPPSASLPSVALDADGKQTPVPPAIPETAEERRRYDDVTRRQYRLPMRGRV
jgi:acyl-CoA hydrolase